MRQERARAVKTLSVWICIWCTSYNDIEEYAEINLVFSPKFFKLNLVEKLHLVTPDPPNPVYVIIIIRRPL